MSLLRSFIDCAARWQASVYLLGWFCIHLAVSGLTTAWLIIRPAVRPQAGLMRVTYDGLSEVGAAILGCLVTLTPGTTVIDVDPEKQTILLHVLKGGVARFSDGGLRGAGVLLMLML